LQGDPGVFGIGSGLRGRIHPGYVKKKGAPRDGSCTSEREGGGVQLSVVEEGRECACTAWAGWAVASGLGAGENVNQAARGGVGRGGVGLGAGWVAGPSAGWFAFRLFFFYLFF